MSHSGLFHVLQRLGCPATLLAILQGFHNGKRATIQFNGARSNEFDVCCGVKQGCVLAPNLFGIYFSAVLRWASTLTANNSLDAELNTKIGCASTTFGRLQSRVWNNSHLSLKVNVRIYESCVLSVLLYGSETWPIYRREEHKLNAFHFHVYDRSLACHGRIGSRTPPC